MAEDISNLEDLRFTFLDLVRALEIHGKKKQDIAALYGVRPPQHSELYKTIEVQRKKYGRSISYIKQKYVTGIEKLTPVVEALKEETEAEFIVPFKSLRSKIKWLTPLIVLFVLFLCHLGGFFTSMFEEPDIKIQKSLIPIFGYFANLGVLVWLIWETRNIKVEIYDSPNAQKSVNLVLVFWTYVLYTWIAMYTILFFWHLYLYNNIESIMSDNVEYYILNPFGYEVYLNFLIMAINAFNSIFMFSCFYVLDYPAAPKETNVRFKTNFTYFISSFVVFMALSAIDSLYNIGSLDEVLSVIFSCIMAVILLLLASKLIDSNFSDYTSTIRLSIIFFYGVFLVASPINNLAHHNIFIALFSIFVFAIGKFCLGDSLLKVFSDKVSNQDVPISLYFKKLYK